MLFHNEGILELWNITFSDPVLSIKAAHELKFWNFGTVIKCHLEEWVVDNFTFLANPNKQTKICNKGKSLCFFPHCFERTYRPRLQNMETLVEQVYVSPIRNPNSFIWSFKLVVSYGKIKGEMLLISIYNENEKNDCISILNFVMLTTWAFIRDQ